MQGVGNLKITVCSDVHINYYSKDYGCDPNFVPSPIERFRLIAAEAKRWGADVFMNLGDFVQRWETEDELEALQLWQSFPGDRIAVYGNHDGERMAKEVYLKNMGMPAPYYFRDVGQGWRIIVLDSGTPVGLPDEEQLQWFEQTILNAPGRCVVAIHGSPWRSPAPVFRQPIAKANAMAKTAKVAAFLFGHTHHTSIEVADGGTHYIEINSPNYRWDSSPSGPGPQFYTSVPFANISLQGDGTLIMQGFGQEHAWAMPNHCPESDYVPRDGLTHQISYGDTKLRLP